MIDLSRHDQFEFQGISNWILYKNNFTIFNDSKAGRRFMLSKTKRTERRRFAKTLSTKRPFPTRAAPAVAAPFWNRVQMHLKVQHGACRVESVDSRIHDSKRESAQTGPWIIKNRNPTFKTRMHFIAAYQGPISRSHWLGKFQHAPQLF